MLGDRMGACGWRLSKDRRAKRGEGTQRQGAPRLGVNGRTPQRAALVIGHADFGKGSLGRARQLCGEIGDGFGVDFALVPQLQHGEIGLSGFKLLAPLPAIICKIVRG